MKKAVCVVLMVLMASVAFAGSLADITWITEDYPPYNFEENGVKKGISIDILKEIWKKVGLDRSDADIKIWPWNKGVQTLKNEPNTCLFATTLTAERQNDFGWKYVLSIPQVVKDGSGNHLIAKKTLGIKIGSPDDIKNTTYKIGVVRGDVGEGLVMGTGIDKSKIDQASDPDTLIKKVVAGRFDIISYGYSTVVTKMKELGLNPDDYEVIYTFPPAPMGYAFHKDTDPAVLEKFQKALDELNADGTAAKIREKYM